MKVNNVLFINHTMTETYNQSSILDSLRQGQEPCTNVPLQHMNEGLHIPIVSGSQETDTDSPMGGHSGGNGNLTEHPANATIE